MEYARFVQEIGPRHQKKPLSSARDLYILSYRNLIGILSESHRNPIGIPSEF